MGIKVNQYDTIRDAKGQRYRITEISESLGACKARKVGIDGQVVSKGRERTIMLDDIDGRKYTRVNLAPVQVTKQEPRPDLVRKSQETKKASVEELFIKDEKAPQTEKDEPSKDEAEKSIEGGREKNKPKAHTLEDTFEEFRKKNEEDIEILKAELKDRVRENIDLKKTISKMQQQHEAEVADLKDRIMEAEAEANAAKKRKDEILKERTQYADALDNDSVAFEEILSLAETIQLVSTASAKLAKQIITKTEGRI